MNQLIGIQRLFVSKVCHSRCSVSVRCQLSLCQRNQSSGCSAARPCARNQRIGSGQSEKAMTSKSWNPCHPTTFGVMLRNACDILAFFNVHAAVCEPVHPFHGVVLGHVSNMAFTCCSLGSVQIVLERWVGKPTCFCSLCHLWMLLPQ